MKRLFLFLILSIVFYACKDGKNEQESTTADSGLVDLTELPDSLKAKEMADSIAAIEINKEAVLKSLTKKTFLLIKTHNYRALDSLIHPEKGIRFSPYANINEADKKFSKEEFALLFTKNKNQKYTWGAYDGSDEPIILTAQAYFNKFVYAAGFENPEKLELNKTIGKGNTINNIHTFYKDEDFTESYFSGSKQKDGLDWKSVRLIFKQIDGQYYLIGIVHDQWTI